MVGEANWKGFWVGYKEYMQVTKACYKNLEYEAYSLGPVMSMQNI